MKLDYHTAKALAHPIRWQIVQELSKKPTYGKQLANILSISEQKVYHHLKILERAAIIRIERIESNKGAFAKYYTLTNPHLLELKPTSSKNTSEEQCLLAEIIARIVISSPKKYMKIIVGNPEPHGPYNAISRDGYLSSLLTWSMKNYLPSTFGLEILTDSEFYTLYPQGLKQINAPLITIGGPITNVLTNEVLSLLKKKRVPLRITGPPWKIKTPSNIFEERNSGIILIFKDEDVIMHPLIVFAGIGRRGTKSTLLSLEQIRLDLNLVNKDWFGIVIQGHPLKGKNASDIKHVKVLEIVT